MNQKPEGVLDRNRWKDNDVRRSVKITTDAGLPWDGVEASKYLYKEVLAAL